VIGVFKFETTNETTKENKENGATVDISGKIFSPVG